MVPRGAVGDRHCRRRSPALTVSGMSTDANPLAVADRCSCPECRAQAGERRNPVRRVHRRRTGDSAPFGLKVTTTFTGPLKPRSVAPFGVSEVTAKEKPKPATVREFGAAVSTSRPSVTVNVNSCEAECPLPELAVMSKGSSVRPAEGEPESDARPSCRNRRRRQSATRLVPRSSSPSDSRSPLPRRFWSSPP